MTQTGWVTRPICLWGWSAAGGVFVAESAGPDVVASGEGLVGPAVFVALAVVVSAEGAEFVDCGVPGLGPGFGVVEVGFFCWHATSWGDTGPVSCGHPPCLFFVVSAFGGAVVYDESGGGVGDDEPPFGVLLLFGDLAGDVGDDRPVPGEFTGGFVESGQCFEVDVNVDAAFPGGFVGVLPGEQVNSDIGAELVDAPVVSGQGYGDGVDMGVGFRRLVGCKVGEVKVGGAGGVRILDHPPSLPMLADTGFWFLRGRLRNSVCGSGRGADPTSTSKHRK